MTDETVETPNKSHYELLLRCAQKEDFSEWNDFVSISDDIIKLRGADLSGLTLTSILLTNKKGKGADLYAANLENSKIDTIDFSEVHLSKANFRNAKISNCLFSESTCIKTNFTSATFVLVNFSRANLHQANFRKTEFYECDFYEALFTMANVESAKFMGGGRNPFLKKKSNDETCAEHRSTERNLTMPPISIYLTYLKTLISDLALSKTRHFRAALNNHYNTAIADTTG
ncbi:pentapeptide repeat-containing protein [Pseudomonas sp. MWU318]|uniref:pentapeptide repeat-containing protein n=1 Tax=Pseudomonas sp. MWU318 TaxID=2802569 RepID=UPI001925C1F8|nr:pentapeptide repeat-containing protein [Pseudomonas sp. MWU318]